MEGSISNSDFSHNVQADTESFGGKAQVPSQYYVDLFYSQLAYSYYSSLHFYWRENFCRIMRERGVSVSSKRFSRLAFHDPLSHMADKGVQCLTNVYSDVSQDFGSRMQLTGSVFYRGDLGNLLLAQAYDSSIEDPKVCDVTTEFALIAEYDSLNKSFSYPGEKRYPINFWERYHISILMKAIFVFMFFDVSKEFYIVLISLYFFYVRGMFDGIQDLFERISSSHPMDATLAELRRRRAEIELERQQEPAPGPDNQDQGPSESSLSHSQEDPPEEEFQDGSSVISAYEEAHFLDLLDPLVPNEVPKAPPTDDARGSDKPMNQEAVSEATPEASRAPENNPNQDVSYVTRIIYQTIGMYVFTLMPWWNPDPTYLV
ncbi:putative transmembrane domain-containing protein [Cryptosporidium canis]|uniref:Transmembrane domain-containing protein n=1 Tax=Cryptosporidium canis TaxID=195482 RepID=A0A9D5HWL2_9CRYT|nr:putative transmembrane domain-containing protein [Cryptosporidium canis]